MRWINGTIGTLLAGLALWHLFQPEPLKWVCAYGGGSILAFSALYGRLCVPMTRFLAIATTGAMFFYFAGFFSMAPHLHPDWYAGKEALHAVDLLLAAFAMIPVLSEFSCRLKADCVESRDTHASRGRLFTFFTVPNR